MSFFFIPEKQLFWGLWGFLLFWFCFWFFFVIAISAKRTEHVSQSEKLSLWVNDFLREMEWWWVVVHCISSYLAFLPQLKKTCSFPNNKITKMKTHHCEVVHGTHPSVLTVGSTGAFCWCFLLSQRDGRVNSSSVVLQLGNIGSTNLLCLQCSIHSTRRVSASVVCLSMLPF